MNTDQAKGEWHKFKGRIRDKWGKLTEDEVEQTGGKLEELAGRIQSAYGTKKEEAKAQLTRLRDSI